MFRRIMNGNVHQVRVLSIGFIVAMGAAAAFAQVEGDYQVQPIFTRYAETAKKITFNANAKVFASSCPPRRDCNIAARSISTARMAMSSAVVA
jgi:hypothetical protein